MARNTNDWDDDDDFDGDDSRGNDVPDLRKAYNALKKQLKEAQSQNQALQQSVRERSIKDVLAAKGLPEKIARFIPDSITSNDDVLAWVEDNGDVFGVQAPQSDNTAPVQQDELPADIQALARISAQQSSGAPYSGDESQLAALIAAAQSPAELNKILFGNATGPAAS